MLLFPIIAVFAGKGPGWNRIMKRIEVLSKTFPIFLFSLFFLFFLSFFSTLAGCRIISTLCWGRK